MPGPRSAEFLLEEIRKLLSGSFVSGALSGIPVSQDVSWKISLEGRSYIASDSAPDQRVTGQTSYDPTTPTFLLDNPAGSDVIILPHYYNLTQTGTVAGGPVKVETEAKATSSYSSGGVEEGISSVAFGHPNPVSPQGKLYSNPTALSAVGRSVGHLTTGQDVDPAEGIINIYEWQPPVGFHLYPDCSMRVFTYSDTPGPTWGWYFAWTEIPLSWLG